MNATNSLLDTAVVALQNGDDAALEQVLSDGFDPNSCVERKTDPETYPVLFVAATNHRGNTCLEQLLAAGADPDAVGRVSLIFNKTWYEQSDMTTLMVAVCEKSLRCVRALLAAGADSGLQNAAGETALSLARKAGGKQIIKLLEKATAERPRSDADNSTLHQAVRDGRIELIDKLLAAGASVNKPDDSRRTPLMLAIQQGDAIALGKLLDAGADASIRWPGRRESTWSKVMEQRSAVNLAGVLLSAVDDPRTLANAPDEVGDECAWLWSYAFRMQRKGQAAAMTQLLLDAGLDANERLSNGMTPLLLAATRTDVKSVDAISMLLAAGADPQALTAINVAAARRRETEIAAMEASGRDVSALRGRTETHKPLSLLQVAKDNNRKVHGYLCELLERENVQDEYDKAGTVLTRLEAAATSDSFVALTARLSTALQSQPKAWKRRAGVVRFSVSLKAPGVTSREDADLQWLEPYQQQAAAADATLVYRGLPDDPDGTVQLLLVPTRSWAAILRICGTNADNYGLSTCDVVNKLAELHSTWPFELQGCGHDFAALRFRPTEKYESLHAGLVAFCPDLEDDDATDDLSEFYLEDGRCFLWWD